MYVYFNIVHKCTVVWETVLCGCGINYTRNINSTFGCILVLCEITMVMLVLVKYMHTLIFHFMGGNLERIFVIIFSLVAFLF